MESNVSLHEAQAALDDVERGRLRIIDEIDVPGWYWWGVALGWIALGVIADVADPWVTTVATFLYGAIHATVAGRVVDGRHRSGRLAVHADVAGRLAPRLVIGGLLAMVVVTIAVSLAAQADGARHPTTIASALVAVIILLGGPRLLTIVRRRAARAA